MAQSDFYIAPAGQGIGNKLAGLGEIIGRNRQRKQEEEALAAEQAALEEQALMQQGIRTEMAGALERGDTAEVQRLALENPWIGESLDSAMGIGGDMADQQRAQRKEALGAVLSNPSQAVPILTSHIERIVARGGNPSESQMLLEEFQNPETADQALKTAETMFAITDGGYDAYRESMARPQTQPDPYEEDQNGILRYVSGDNAGKPVFPEVETTTAGLLDKDLASAAKGIRDEISSENKDFRDIANSWDRIAASADEPSAAGDLALIFNFMKMLDPGSTVREGEFANAQNTAGVPGRIRSTYNNLINGQRLNPDQRIDFFTQAQNIFDASQDRANNIVEQYVSIAERMGIDREDVVIDRGDAPDITGALNMADITGTDASGHEEGFEIIDDYDRVFVVVDGKWVPAEEAR